MTRVQIGLAAMMSPTNLATAPIGVPSTIGGSKRGGAHGDTIVPRLIIWEARKSPRTPPPTMKESIVTGPLFNPDSDEEYLDPDVDMNNDESGTPHAENITPVLPGEVSLFRCISDNPLLKFGPLPQPACNAQEGRNDREMDNSDGTFHPKSIMHAPPQNSGAGALFRCNPNSPLLKLGSKRPVEEDEEDSNRKDEDRKYRMRVNFLNPPPPPSPPFRLKEANQALNKQLQAQQALLMNQNKTIQDAQHTLLEFQKTTEEIAKARMEPQALLVTQNKTIHDAQQMMLEFKKTAEEAAKDRVDLLKIIEGLKANQVAQETEMTRLKVQKERELAVIHQRTRHANATATAPSDVPATPTTAQAVETAPTALPVSNTEDTEMQYTVLHQPVITANEATTPEHPPATEAMTMDPQPLAMQPPGPTHTVSSNSASAGQSRLTADTPESSEHQPHSRRTNWGKLKEQARKDRSKRREVLTAVNPDDSPDEDEGEDDANDIGEDDHNDITHISKKELRDMLLAAAKTALEMGKRSTRKVQRGNEAKRTKRTDLQKERETDQGWERQIFLSYVRNLFETVFDVTHEEDFAEHEPPSPEEIRSFNRGRGEGPNPDDLRIDMKGTISSKWNEGVVDMLLEKLLQKKADPESWGDMPERSDAYFEDLIHAKLTRARSIWRNAQPHLNDEGELESIDEVERRMITTKEERDRRGRAYTRRKTRYARRMNILEKVIDIKESEGSTDTPIWKWLRLLIKTLGEEGTSSDESEVDEQMGSTIYRVHKMPWRRKIDFEISMIDKLRFHDKDLFSNKGSKPSPRLRNDRNQGSSRKTPKGLPKAVYNNEWIAKQTPRERRGLKISKEPFEWMNLGPTR